MTDEGSTGICFDGLRCISNACVDEGDGDGDGDELTDQSDDFEDGNFDGWSIFDTTGAEVTVFDGALRVEPSPWSPWYQDRTSVLVYKQMTGDFMMTATCGHIGLASPRWHPDQSIARQG